MARACRTKRASGRGPKRNLTPAVSGSQEFVLDVFGVLFRNETFAVILNAQPLTPKTDKDINDEKSFRPQTLLAQTTPAERFGCLSSITGRACPGPCREDSGVARRRAQVSAV